MDLSFREDVCHRSNWYIDIYVVKREGHTERVCIVCDRFCGICVAIKNDRDRNGSFLVNIQLS